MITVGIVSDTHGWLDPQLLDVFAGAQLILHAGDVGTQAVLDGLQGVAPVRAVRGNIDGGELLHLPETIVEEVGGLRIGMLHIAGNPRRPRAGARQLIREEKLDLFICGHSHIPVVGKVGECVWLNPGAAGRQGFHRERHGLLLHVRPDSTYTLDRVHLGSRSTRSGAS